MILRPLEPPAASAKAVVPAWPVVEGLQRHKYRSCWMITQPSHAALAGDLAARLAQPPSAKLDAGLVRAIALHDAGWGLPDAQAVTRSRAGENVSPQSFLEMHVAEFLAAWTQSIDIVQPVSAAGGYIVSRHFWRLAEHRLAGRDDSKTDLAALQQFSGHESKRQKKLAAKQSRSIEELEALTDLLQFCDLLSLYVCCGARETVEFPECFGVMARLRVEAEGYKLDPPLIEPGAQFRVAALRHPPTKEVSGQEIEIKFAGGLSAPSEA